MLPTTILAALSVIIAFVSAQTYYDTSPTQDYFLLSQRQMRNNIYASDLKINSVDTRGADSIKSISEQHLVILREIERADDALLPLQALSPVRKQCVQKYRSLFLTLDAVQTSLTSCRSTAQSRVNSLTYSAKTYLNNAKTAANTNLPKAIATCNDTHENNQTKLEECVLTNVETFSKTVQTNLDSFDRSLETSLCTLSDLTRDAIRCSFVIEQSTFVTIGRTLGLIDYCIKESESLCSCENQNYTDVQKEDWNQIPSVEFEKEYGVPTTNSPPQISTEAVSSQPQADQN